MYNLSYHRLRTPNEVAMKPFLLKSRTFVLGQTNWADKFWGIWGIFGQTISTHFDAVSSLSMFSIIQPIFLKNLTLYIQIPNSCVRSPCKLCIKYYGFYKILKFIVCSIIVVFYQQSMLCFYRPRVIRSGRRLSTYVVGEPFDLFVCTVQVVFTAIL